MAYITDKGIDETGMPALYVGDERMEGIVSTSVEHGYSEIPKITITAYLKTGEQPTPFEVSEKESSRFSFKKGIAV